MTRRRQLLKTLAGLLLGALLAHLLRPAARPACAARAAPAPRRARLLLAGVMTAAAHLETRARAVQRTWGRRVPGRLLFFGAQGARAPGLPLVALAGVDDAYPPQRKSFRMLRHMYEHHLEEFEWFLRADDDVYVRVGRLERLLRSVDARRAWFVGQTGRGRGEEALAMDDDENFCMGGPGVVLSRETLRRVGPHLERCLGEMVTGHEDVEVGRCVRRYAGISCTWSYEMQVILYHNQSGEAAFSGDLKQKEVHRAITLHPVKQPQFMYRLDKYVKSLKVQQLEQETLTLHRIIAASMDKLGHHNRQHLQEVELVAGLPLFPERRGSGGFLGDVALLGSPQRLTRHNASKLVDVLDWELIQKNVYTYKDSNPRKRIGSSLKEGLSDVVRDVMEVINSYSKQRGRIIDFKEILYGYWRLDPVHGVDLILDLLLVYRKYRGHKMTVEVRRHSYLQQTFTGTHVREVGHKPQNATAPPPVHRQIVNRIISTLEDIPLFTSRPPEAATVHFILPLSGRSATLRRFLRMYETVCLRAGEPATLLIVLYEDALAANLRLVEALRRRHGAGAVRVARQTGPFSRARALDAGVRRSPDGLLLLIDVDIVFDAHALQRVRRNARAGASVYYPIVFSLYDPRLLNATGRPEEVERGADEGRGFWREFGYGVVGIYKRDYEQLGGFNLSISGWGMEDVGFFDRAMRGRLRIVRSVDPGLVHVYHSINCDSHLDVAQHYMCLGTRASMLGAVGRLQQVYMKYKSLFDDGS